jgi:hypothetical protein
MKIPLMLAISLAVAMELSAQTAADGATKSKLPRIVLPPDKPATRKAGTASKAGSEAKPSPGATGGATKAGGKQEEKAAKIEGVEIARGEKGFLGIQIVDSTFKLSFYDEKKKPVAPDVDRAALRWDPKYKVGEERVVLTPGDDGKSLSSPKNIRPPYNFKLFVTLVKEATEGQSPSSETHVIDFRQ